MKGGAGLWKSRPVPTLTMTEKQYTFLRSIGEYEAGKTYTLDVKIGRWQVRFGNAVLANKSATQVDNEKPVEKKATRKKAARKERASAEPQREQATGDE